MRKDTGEESSPKAFFYKYARSKMRTRSAVADPSVRTGP